MTRKQKLIAYLEGELELSTDDEGVLILSFPESNVEQVAKDIKELLEV